MTFIAIEGADAAGKDTQSKLLAKHLNAKLISFPAYETPIGKLILRHLKKDIELQPGPAATEKTTVYSNTMDDALMFQCLQFTNRLEKAAEISQTLHTLKQDVVADRYLASAIVYGGADGLDVDYLVEVQKWLPQPDLNILLDIHPGTSVSRRPERRDRYEEQPGLMEEVSRRYHALWQDMGKNWVIIDAERPVEEVHQTIVGAVEYAKRKG